MVNPPCFGWAGDGRGDIGECYSLLPGADRHGVPGDQIFFLDDFAGMEGPGLPLCDGLATMYDMKDGSISELLPTRS
jgi:hypothetical protein